MKLDEILSEVAALRSQVYDDYITVNGLKIRYAAIGNGPPLLLLHGFGGFLESWAYNAPALSRHFRVYAIDLPGHGLSDKPDIDYTASFAIECAAGVLSAFGIKKTNLIGHSLGGAIAVSIALKLPGMIDRLVLVDCAGLTSQLPLAYRISSHPPAGEMVMRMVTRTNMKLALGGLFYDPKVLNEEMLDIAFANTSRPGARKALLRIMRNYLTLAGPRPEAILTRRLADLSMPVLFIHGAQDRLFPLNQVRKAFRLTPDARVKVLNQCGHCPQIEKPVEFNEAVLEFLATG